MDFYFWEVVYQHFPAYNLTINRHISLDSKNPIKKQNTNSLCSPVTIDILNVIVRGSLNIDARSKDLNALLMMIQVFWDVQKLPPKYGGSRGLEDHGKFLPDCTVFHCRRHCLSQGIFFLVLCLCLLFLCFGITNAN